MRGACLFAFRFLAKISILTFLVALPLKVIASQVPLHESIRQVENAPATGPINRHRPYITRRNLSAGETDATIEFEVALKMRNFAELQARVARHERISPQEMAEKYDPLYADYAKVSDWLTSQGFEITQQDKNHLSVFARGKVSRIQQAMQTSFARVTYEGNEYTSAITAPSVPDAIAPFLVGINGLQTHLQLQRHLVLKPNSLTGPNAPYLPSQLATAYHANGLYSSNITGSGQTIAIVIDTFPATSDLTSFWSTYGVSQTINNVTFIQAVAGTLPSPSGEETLDTEWSSSIAPGAKVRVYASTSLGLSEIDQTYQRVYSDVINHPEYNIHQMSMSFGIPENYVSGSYLATDAQYFANLASAGVTIFASSGDDGATPDPSHLNIGPSPSSPACDPSITGVGGTSLTVDSSGNPSTEVVWNNSYGASGGGVSQYFSRPYWQTGTGVPIGATRLVPDVAAPADPLTGAVVIKGGAQLVYGGTSWSSPTWAGFCALFNQNRANNGLGPIGILGPYLYPQIGTSNFRDITSGNNNFNGGTGYSAGTGYDLTTGIGVPDVQNLAQTLVTYTPAPAPPAPPPPPSPVLHSFLDGSVSGEGYWGAAPLVQGMDGNLYGTTVSGGTNSGGMAFKITLSGTTTILHQFASNNEPTAAMILASDGNFYGTTYYGGTANDGTVFKLTSGGTFTTVHSFTGSTTDGKYTQAALIQATDGNFYGTTINGGTKGQGTVFKLTPAGTFSLLHSFNDGTVANDGTTPMAGLVQGTDGNFYGTTQNGGVGGNGTVFQITPGGTVTVLHRFKDGTVTNDGQWPVQSLVQGTDGYFYGMTQYGGASGSYGTIFRISSAGSYLVLHRFGDGSVTNDGRYPTGALIQARDGNFYGTTSSGALTGGTGFVLTPQGVETILRFFGDGNVTYDAVHPSSALLQGMDGKFYGTSPQGGSANKGTVFVMGTAPTITSVASTTFTLGQAGSFLVTANGTPTPTYSAVGLPSWASLNTTTGVLSGTPTTNSGSPFSFSIVASDGIRPNATQTFTLTVQGPTAPVITSGAPPSGTVNFPYSFYCQASGSPAATFTLASGNLPPGVTLSSAGILSGVPTQTGTFTGTIDAGNGNSPDSTQNFSIAINAQIAPAISGGAPPTTGSTGIIYNFTYTGTGSPTPTFSVTSGSLPPGLTLSSAGVISGTPAAGGIYTGTVSATNGVGTAAAQDFTITVQQPPSFANGAPPSYPTVGVPFSFAYQANGYPAPTFSVTGTLPTGLTLSPSGVLSGTPTQTGTFTGTVTASNGVSPSSSQSFGMIPSSPPSQAPVITNGPPPATILSNGTYNFSYTATGYPVPTFSVTSGALPNGITLSTTGVLSGTPTGTGTYAGTVTATNGVLPNATQSFGIEVQQAPSIISGTPPTTAMSGTTYSFTFAATGYPVPTFSLTSGSLPPGLTLSAGGVLSGVPISAGTYTGRVTASNDTGINATQDFTITILDASTDTPTMPQWALMILAVTLFLMGTGYLSRESVPGKGRGA